MFRAPYPAHLPHFSYVLDNVPGSMDQKAKLLEISPATLLFWESTWGIQYIESISGLRTSTYFAQAQAIERKNKRLQAQIALLEAELADSTTGPANLPVFRIG